jgi:pimeloyl-ACP methyl ester carboxylesterase
MYYEDYDFADPWREHETVVLHPGNLKDHRLWYAWIPLLARHYRVITLDARGHGRSTVPPPGYPWSMSGFAQDLRGLLDRLEIDQAHLIGETTGGPITLQFAHDFPQRVHTVTQCSAYFKHNPASPTAEDYKHIRELGLEAWVRQKMNRRITPGADDAGYAEWYAGVMISNAQHVAVETLRYLGTLDMTSLLPKIRVPTLILTAEHSETRASWSEPMHALMPGSKLVVIPGTHGFVQHTAPEQCFSAWRTFVREYAHSSIE